MVPGFKAAQSHAPAQSRQGASSMWAVVVLGILSAVFAWVWFGGRGDKTRSESGDSQLSSEAVRETEPCEAATSTEGEDAGGEAEEPPISEELHVPQLAEEPPISGELHVPQLAEEPPISGELHAPHRAEEPPISRELHTPHRAEEPPISRELHTPHRAEEPPISGELHVPHVAEEPPISGELHDPQVAEEPPISGEPHVPQLAEEPPISGEPHVPQLAEEPPISGDPHVPQRAEELPIGGELHIPQRAEEPPISRELHVSQRAEEPPINGAEEPIISRELQGAEACCPFPSEKQERQLAEESVPHLKGLLAPEEPPVLASIKELTRHPASQEARVQLCPEGEKLSYAHQDEVGHHILNHNADLEEEEKNSSPLDQTDDTRPLHRGEGLLGAQEDAGTVCLKEKLTEDGPSDVQDGKLSDVCGSLSMPSVNVTPVRVEISNENHIEQYGYMKLGSPEQESTGGSQKIVNDHLAAVDLVSSQTDHEELLETLQIDEVLTATTGDILVNGSELEKDDHDEKGSSLGEKSCFAAQAEPVLQDGNSHRTKRVAAVQPMPQNVSLGFKVHYITDSGSQIIAVTGDHEKLGRWEVYVPLTPEKDGLWSHSITLPGDTDIEWKFVMVENGKIKRWEECNNRCLKTAHEDIAPQQWWACP